MRNSTGPKSAKNRKTNKVKKVKKAIKSPTDEEFIRNVFVDTNIFEKNNFFNSTSMHALLRYAREDVINIYMTKISKMELISRMKKNLNRYHESHRQLMKSFQKDSRILQNFINYEEFKIEDFTINEAFNELVLKLNRLIVSSKIKVLDSKVNADKVFELYYASKPPFSIREEKKYEFPDAFIILTIDNWCRINKQRMVFLTQDADFNGYASKFITFKADLKAYLEEITEYWDLKRNRKIIPRINSILAKNSQYFVDRVDDKLSNIIDFRYDRTIFSHPVISKIEYLNHSIISIWNDFAEIIINYRVYYEYYLIPNPKAYDQFAIEDMVKGERFYGTIDVPSEFEVYYSYSIDRTDLKRINSNEHILIQIPDMDS